MRVFTFLTLLLITASGLRAQTPVQLKDINPGADDSSPTNFFQYGDQALFRADSPDFGAELWITDGTEDGTMMLKDINTDPTVGRGNSSPDGFYEYEGKVYFRARSAEFGSEVWVTDGTTDGTMMLKDIQVDGNGAPFDFIEYNGLLYFTANDGINGSELWVTDGTEDGTVLAVDIAPGDGISNPNNKILFRGLIYFSASDGVTGNELWMSDGTPDGTMLVADIRTGSGNSLPSQFFVRGAQLFFRANDGINGSELWVSNGTTNPDDTFLLVDLRNGEESSGPSDLFNLGPFFFFAADETGNGDNMWVINFATNPAGLFFLEFNDEGPDNPRELTTLVEGQAYALVSDTSNTEGQSDIFLISILDGSLSFDGLGDRLDGLGGADISDLAWSGSTLYFSYETADAGRELAGIDILDETASVVRFSEIVPGADGSGADDLFLLNNQLLFEADLPDSGKELWTADINAANVTLTTDDGITLSDGDTIDFGNFDVGTLDSIVVTYNNSGNTNSTLLNFQFAQDTELSTFSLNNVGPGNTLPPAPNNASISIIVLPTTTGEFQDTFRTVFITGRGENDISFLVRGNVVAPALALEVDDVAFGIDDVLTFDDVEEGTDSTRTLTIDNSGEGNLIVSGVSIAGDDSPFSVTDVEQTVGMGESLDIPVTYADDDLGEDVDTLLVETNIGVIGVPLRGNYLAAPNFMASVDGAGFNSGDELTFNDVPANTDSTRTIVLSNAGSAELMISSVSIADSTIFSVGDVPATIASGATADVEVTYSPDAVATATDVLTFTTNAGDFVVNLSGMSIVNSIVDRGIPATAAYPNPTTGNFRLELAGALGEADWKITSATGQVVSQGIWPAGRAAFDFDLSELVAGAYQLEVVDGNKRLTARVVKY